MSARGLRNQEELWRWYRNVIESDDVVRDTTDGALARQQKARASLKAAIAKGWILLATECQSPADMAGIDFVWFHKDKGWFPIDVTARDKTKVPALITVVTITNSTERGEVNVVARESKTVFAETLVGLSREEPVLHIGEPTPPPLKVSKDPKAELIAFSDRLKACAKYNETLFGHWAEHLKKAIGFQITRQQKAAGVEAVNLQELLSQMIKGRVAQFLKTNPKTGIKDLRNFGRRYGISYVKHTDTLETRHPKTPKITRLAAVIRAEFERQYQALVSKNGTSEALFKRKRAFQTQGEEEIIHGILDALERLTAEGHQTRADRAEKKVKNWRKGKKRFKHHRSGRAAYA